MSFKLPAGVDEEELLVYNQPWLSIAAGARMAKAYRGDTVAGILPYSFNEGRVRNPHWARIIAPVTNLDLSDRDRLEIYKKLIHQLPIVVDARFVTRHDPLLWQAFTSEGFSMVSDHMNFIRRPTPSRTSWNDAHDEIMEGLPSRTRAYVRQARDQLEIVSIGPREFCLFYADNLRQKGS